MKNKGFTLTELLVVIVILGIITGLSIPLIRNIRGSNEDRQYKAYMDTVKYSAKLYVDSYNEDLFGHRRNGCSIIEYSSMEEKGLLKDIPVEDISCNSDKTFVKVVKMDDKYSYVTSIGCGKKAEDGTVNANVIYPKDRTESVFQCIATDRDNMNITADPAPSPNALFQRKNIKVVIESDTGILENASIYYGFSESAEGNDVVDGWHKLPIKILGGNEQKRRILDGHPISIASDDVTTPAGKSGNYYLVLHIMKLEDLAGENWTNDNSDYKRFGPYVVDNIKPDFKDSKVVSSLTEYNTNTPKLDLKVEDNLSTENLLRMCISYDSDTCPKTMEATRGSRYISYQENKNKVLDKIQDNYDGSNHIIYINVSDGAGNVISKAFEYKLAYRYTVTLDPNGGSACDPSSKTFTFNEGNTPTIGELCTTERNRYIYQGWNTKADGSGTEVTDSTPVTSTATIFAKWKLKETPSERYFNNHQCQNETVGDPNDYAFTYTGACKVVKEDANNWKIYLYGDVSSRSGTHTLTFAEDQAVDLFLVGGGGAAGRSWGGGGGGGYTNTFANISVTGRVGYSVTVGAGGAKGSCAGRPYRCSVGTARAGGSTSVTIGNTYSVNGGNGGECGNGRGWGQGLACHGGSDDVYGGKGGSAGGCGYTNMYCDGVSRGATLGNSVCSSAGQGYSTCEWATSANARGTCPSGIQYAAGGYGGCWHSGNGAANTGNGGSAGMDSNSFSGGSGIVVVRNKR